VDEEAPETVTMVSALPNRLVLSRLLGAFPGSNDRLHAQVAALGLAGRGAEQPSSPDACRQEDDPPALDAEVADTVDLEAAARSSGLEPIRVSGCPPELIAVLARKAVRHALRSDRSPPEQVDLVRPTRMLRRIVELGSRAENLHVHPPEAPGALVPDIDDVTGADDLDPGMVLAERLWRRLNSGCTLILEADGAARSASDGGAPGGRPGPRLADDPVRQAIARDRLPLLRDEATGVWRRVPTSLVVVELHEATQEAAVDGLRRLLDEVWDAAFYVPHAPASVRPLLQAEFGSDPRFLRHDAPLPLGTPYVVHTSIDLPLTTEMVAILTRRAMRRDVSVVRVLLPGEGERPRHLSVTRRAALDRSSSERQPLEGESSIPDEEAVDHITRDAGLEWVLPERLGLAPEADDGPADLLGPSAALSEDELTAIARLQVEMAQEQRARQQAEHRLAVATADLEEQIAARERAESSLADSASGSPWAPADVLGRVRRRLRR
jgi:hypothetical protein